MIAKDSQILPEDFNDLKQLIKDELTRRGKPEGKGQNQSVGSMAAYAGPNYDYAIVPDEGVKILFEHIQKLADPINAVQKAITVSNNDLVLADALNTLTTVLISLSSASVTSNNLEKTGCSASCSGLCYSGCYSACTSCTGSCSSSCRGGCTGSCSGSCRSGCSGCGSSCSNSCSNTCSGGCSTSCLHTCSGSCNDTCSENCADDCYGSCSTGCGNACGNECSTGCGGKCGGCEGTCSVTCNDLAWWNK